MRSGGRRLPRFNLVVSHLPGTHARRLVREELRALLGFDSVWFPVQGQSVTLAEYRGDPLEAVDILREGLPEDTVILKVVPALRVVEPEVEEVKSAVDELLAGAPEGSFAIRIQGRLLKGGRPLGSREAVEALAEGVERPVDLEKPDVLVFVRVVNVRGLRAAAVYVGRPEGVLSLARG